MTRRMRSLVRLARQTATVGGHPREAVREVFYGALALVPSAFPFYENRRHPARSAIRPGHTALVVDGYLGCANTFAAQTLRLANPDLYVARHGHRAAQILEGVRQRVPTLLLVRPPSDAIASIVVRQDFRTPAVELARFNAFYRFCEPVLDEVTVATFDQVTGDIDSVIDRINRRYGTSFAGLRSLGPEGKQLVFDSIEQSDREGHGEETPLRRAYPSSQRDAVLAEVRQALASPSLTRDRREAEALYGRLAGVAIRDGGGSSTPPDR